MSDESVSSLGILADVVLRLARELDPGNRDAPSVVPLTGTEALVLHHVHRHAQASAGETAKALGLQRSNLSTVLRILEAKGMIERRAAAADARRTELFATDLARHSIGELETYWSRLLAPAGVSAADLDQTIAVLEAFEGLFRPSAQPPTPRDDAR